MTTDKPTATFDAVVMGAGVAGLYQLYQLRKEGFKVHCYEAGGDVGGTWYWNRYPGARFDSEAYIYQYLFDEKLFKDWSWSERFPGQPEIERWMHYITDRLDLRKDISFDTRVESAHYDESRGRWTVKTSKGDVIDTQFFVSCAGMLSAPIQHQFPGMDDFKGQIVYTSTYPKEGVDVKGKRVGVIGVGATGIQVIQTLAPEAGHMTVFARTPQYVCPMKNPKLSPADQEAYKDRFGELKKVIPHTFSGFEYDWDPTKTWATLTPEERKAHMEEVYAWGGLKMWLASFSEIFFSKEISDEVSTFVADKMRDRLKHDKHLVDVLVPTLDDYGFGTHRVPLENKYLEAYLLPNVEAISVRKNKIAKFVPQGIQLEDGRVIDLDVVILATGFDAGSGALSRVDVRGKGNVSLGDEWHKEIRTTMGFGKTGFPNLLMTATPLSPSAALCNMPTCLQQQTEWITDLVTTMRTEGQTKVEATPEGEDKWVTHHDELANMTLVPKTDSWYMGSNVEGKPRRLLSYIGGVGTYRTKCDEEAAAGYPSFARS